MAIIGFRDPGLKLLTRASIGLPAIGDGVTPATRGTPAIGDRKSASTAASIMATATTATTTMVAVGMATDSVTTLRSQM